MALRSSNTDPIWNRCFKLRYNNTDDIVNLTDETVNGKKATGILDVGVVSGT